MNIEKQKPEKHFKMNRENQHHHLPPKLFDLNDFKVFLYIIFFI